MTLFGSLFGEDSYFLRTSFNNPDISYPNLKQNFKKFPSFFTKFQIFLNPKEFICPHLSYTKYNFSNVYHHLMNFTFPGSNKSKFMVNYSHNNDVNLLIYAFKRQSLFLNSNVKTITLYWNTACMLTSLVLAFKIVQSVQMFNYVNLAKFVGKLNFLVLEFVRFKIDV